MAMTTAVLPMIAKTKRTWQIAKLSNLVMVGVTGFEPAASSSRTMRATKLCYTPLNTKVIIYYFGEKRNRQMKKIIDWTPVRKS